MNADDPVDDVEALRRLHGLAADAHDPRPDPRVRVAVLAAASRAAGSRPQAIDAGAPPFRTRRWPLSAAALLVVSLLTGLVVTQSLHDDSGRVLDGASPAAMVPPATVGAPPADRPSNAVEASGPSTSAIRRRLDESAPRRMEASPAARSTESLAKPKAPVPTSAAPAADPPVPASPPSDAVPGEAAPTPAPRASRSPPSPAAATESHPRPEHTTDREAAGPAKAGVDEQHLAVAAAMATRRDAMRPQVEPEPATPQAWLERIAALRAAGRDAEADREVDALHARYPSFAIPDAARRPAPR